MIFIHPSADVQSSNIGDGTQIWQNCVVLPGAQIGRENNICAGAFIENGAVLGDRVTLKNCVQVWDGVRIGNDVFIGPHVTFTNDRVPRSKKWVEPLVTVIEDGASIGAGAIILPGLVVGSGAMVGAGSVVVKNVPSNCTVIGNPAKEIKSTVP